MRSDTLHTAATATLYLTNWWSVERPEKISPDHYICSCLPASRNLYSIQLPSSWVNPIQLSWCAWKSNTGRVIRFKINTFYMSSFLLIPIALFFADQCPELFSPCPVELWERLDQPAVKLEQRESCAVTQTSEAAVWGTTVAPVRGGRLQLGRGGRRRRRRRRVDGGWWSFSGQDGFHVAVAERAPAPQDGVRGDSELHGSAPWYSAAGRFCECISFYLWLISWVGLCKWKLRWKHNLHKVLLPWQ